MHTTEEGKNFWECWVCQTKGRTIRSLLKQLNTPKDQLIKFNANLSSKYKAALGLLYLEDLIEDSSVEEWIKSFIIQGEVSEI